MEVAGDRVPWSRASRRGGWGLRGAHEGIRGARPCPPSHGAQMSLLVLPFGLTVKKWGREMAFCRLSRTELVAVNTRFAGRRLPGLATGGSVAAVAGRHRRLQALLRCGGWRATGHRPPEAAADLALSPGCSLPVRCHSVGRVADVTGKIAGS